MVDIPADSSTTATVAPGGTFTGEIEIAKDRDWVAVALLAGQSYAISLSTPGADGLPDAYVSIFDASGALLAADDDSGPGLDSLATFTPAESGTYYIQAQALGKGTGSYEIGVREIPPPEFLDSIDWGTALPTTQVSVYFAAAGEVFDGKTSVGWNDYERQQAMLAFQQFANVCNLSFTITDDASSATLKLVNKANSNSWLGYFNPPGTSDAGVGVFNQSGQGWDEDQPGTGGLEQGGYGFITLIHEFGHGMGMAHPHDSGGTSTVWEGVTDAFDSYGRFDLNQGIYSMMSYNDGWQLHPQGPNDADGYGWEGTLMAFDVALMQRIYGANMTYRAGDDTYILPDANETGTFFACLWDAGGQDAIRYEGTTAVTIDLRAAHLGFAEGSGGYVSFARGIYGGYTIANGVVIENASGGAGRDSITGNAAANVLEGGALGDALSGMGGRDTLSGGLGNDSLCGGLGRDSLSGDFGADSFLFLSAQDSGATRPLADRIQDFSSGVDVIDLSALDLSFINRGPFSGAAGELRWRAFDGGALVQADLDGDGDCDFQLVLSGTAHLAAGDFVL